MIFFKEHQYLLIRRESRVVLGRKAVNLWLLVLVLAATFLSIAFSAGSMAYLEEKMNDPFTNWVNINREFASLDKISILKDSLDSEDIKNHYLFDGSQTEVNASLDLVSPTGKVPVFSILYYENMNSDLIAAVLSKENVVNGISVHPDSIQKTSLGVIMTVEALEHLGYDRHHVPAFIDCHQKAEGADTLGYELLDGDYVRAPLPLLAVVKHLPMNKEMISSKYLYSQLNDYDVEKPFNMNNESYVRKMRFFVPDNVDNFTSDIIKQNVPDSLKGTVYVAQTEDRVQERLLTWKKGVVKSVDVGYPGTPISVFSELERAILKQYGSKGVVRVYDYNESMREALENLNNDGNTRSTTSDDVISVHFTRLDSIRPFEHYVKKVSELQIEMTQVNSKENFNAVSIMGNILSLAMIVFSITSIVIFIVNMLQSYFQKVHRNLGTFKAFGISTQELIRVYVAIIAGIVILALVIALGGTWLTELFLSLVGIMKDGEYSWLILWNPKTLWAVVIILIATLLSILFVLRRLLQQTPGDLIYDRN